MKFLERFWFGCGHCHGDGTCPLLDTTTPLPLAAREFGHGPGLVGAVLLVFILPLAMAIAGAYAAGQWGPGQVVLSLGVRQAAGAVAGFLVGVGVAKFAFWTRRRFASAAGGAE